MKTDPDRHPIFVVGTGRSGTTLLRMMLNAHPRIHLTHEASFYLLGGLPRGASPQDWLDRYLKTAAFAWLRLAPKDVRRAVGSRPTSVASIIREMMILQARRHGKERYGDKTPLHAAKLRQICEDFPNARVVNVLRDPRGGIASLSRMPWAASSIGLNLAFYAAGWRAVRPFRHRLYEVRLEDLIERPEETLRGVLDFLGEEFSPEILRHHEAAPVDDLPPFPWFDGAKRPIAKRDGPPAWQRDLPSPWTRSSQLAAAPWTWDPKASPTPPMTCTPAGCGSPWWWAAGRSGRRRGSWPRASARAICAWPW